MDIEIFTKALIELIREIVREEMQKARLEQRLRIWNLTAKIDDNDLKDFADRIAKLERTE